MELLKVKSGGSFFIAFHRDRGWPAVRGNEKGGPPVIHSAALHSSQTYH